MRWRRRAVYLSTVALWLALCARIVVNMVRYARGAPAGMLEDYARSPKFQMLAFTIAYLPVLVIALLIVLGCEWMVFRLWTRFPRDPTRSGS